MFTIQVTHEFCAAHSISIMSTAEPIHGHNFVTTAIITGESLDSDALLCDFHIVHGALVEITAPFANNNINDIPPFDQLNPSAENIARFIADRLAERLDQALLPNARVHAVSITEAPGCIATYTRPKSEV